jgi:hypothetical protein
MTATRNRNAARSSPLTPEHGIRYAFGLSLWSRLHLKLTPGGRRNRTIRWTISDALESVGDARQLEGNLVRSARPLQNNHSFSAEVESRPEQEANDERYSRQEDVVTCDGDASTGDADQVIREQSFLPAGAWFACLCWAQFRLAA